MVTLDDIRKSAESLHILLGAGQRDAAYREHPIATSREALAVIREERARSEGRRASRLDALTHRLLLFQLDRATAAPRDDRSRLITTRSIDGTVAGSKLTLEEARRTRAREPDRDARHALDERITSVEASLESCARHELDASRQIAEENGFPGWIEAVCVYPGLDAAQIPALAEDFVAQTSDMTADILAWRLEKHCETRPFPHGARRHDLAYATSLPEFAGLFLEQGEWKRLAALAHGLGLKPPAEAPTDAPAGAGFARTRDLLAALGLRCAAAAVGPDRPFEDRAFGDPAVWRSASAVWSLLLLNRSFVTTVLGERPPDLIRSVAVAELSRLRLACARADVTARAIGGFSRLEKYTEERVSTIAGAEWPAAAWPGCVDVDLGPVWDLRGAMLAAQITASLQRRFDEDWWRNPRAGVELTRLWSIGSTEPAHQVARGLGAESVSSGPLLSLLTEAIERS